ncbi:MAG TPA: ComEC/Rec2 family competence protein [Anaerolineales bacterium]|nr:ComEC/Rec2 family competence protein [Anaerolineales bacterium]
MTYIPPLALYVLGWLGGVMLAGHIQQPLWAWLLFSTLAGVATIATRRDPTLRNLALATILFGLGGARWVWAQPTIDSSFIAYYNDSGEATLEGYVIDEPDVRDTYVNLHVEADTLLTKGASEAAPVHGVALVQVPRSPEIKYGERIRAHGDLRQPPTYEDFDYADYLARQGVYGILRRAQATVIQNGPLPFWLQWQFAIFRPIYDLKAQALAAIAETFPEPQGSLLSGILLGGESGIPESLKDAFRKTGTSHIVAISGFNISIIAKVFASLFRRIFGEKRSIPLTIVTIAVYTVLAGADASVVRAALMGSLVLISGGFNRPSNGIASLAAAAFLMTAYNPGSLWDVGFQLSATATLGLVVYAEPLTRAATRLLTRFTSSQTAEWFTNIVGEFSILTIAAQITTLPLIAYYFHQISLISLFANLLVLPVQPPVMILGGLAAIGAMIAKPVGAILYWLAWPFVTFTIVVVEMLAKAPLAAIPIDRFPLAALAGMYAVLIGLTWLAGREPNQRPPWLPSVSGWVSSLGLAIAAIGTLAVWNLYLHQPDGRLHVTFFDVGHGDAALIQTPSGRYALIDGGPSPNALAESLGRSLPAGTRALDLVVAAAPEPGSLGGLPALLDRYTLGRVVLAGDAQRSAAYREWTEGLKTRSVPTLTAEVGQRFDLGDGVMLTVIATGPDGATLRLDYGNASFLFPIGLDAKASTDLAASGQITPITVLLAPDHGDQNSISALFLDAAQPSAVVIAIGGGNNPDEQTMKLFGERTKLRTDQRGAISFATDGKQLWAEAER